MARLREAEGDLDGALDLLHEAERVYMGDFFPDVCPIAALKVGVWVRQGRLGEALNWTREQGLVAEDELSYLREFEHITLARVLLARSAGARAERSFGPKSSSCSPAPARTKSPHESPHVVRRAHHIAFYLQGMPRNEGGSYEIRLKGRLDARWAAWFDGLSLTHESDGTTVIRGSVVDQAALHGLLSKVRDLGLPLIAVVQTPASGRK